MIETEKYKKISTEDIEYFLQFLKSDHIAKDQELLEEHAKDYTEDLSILPEVVLFPETVDQISQICAYCHKNHIPLTSRGAGTGLSGGAIPAHGGVVLAMKRMNKVVDLDEKNFQITVEPAVITEELQNLVKEKGLFYPPDPASRGSCFIGGNVAENSGGPKAVKYGVVKDYVLNLEVVLPTGDVIWTGANVLKNSTGYNLTQLLVGSEGTLGVITKIVLKLIPYPQHDVLMLASFRKIEQAAEAVNTIMRKGITPSGLEFMERAAVEAAYQALEYDPLPEDIEAQLLIELDGNYPDQLMQEAEQIFELLQQYDIDEVLFADDAVQKEKLWKARKVIGEAVKRHSIYKEEDTVVPRFYLPELVKYVKALGKEYGFTSVCYGHAGDGNLHVNILKSDMSDDKWNNELPKAIRKLFNRVHQMGGTISGEHGIGLVQKRYMDTVFSEVQLELMRNIKKVFDPHEIMNPGKVIPS